MFYHAKISKNNRIIATRRRDLLLIQLDFVAIIRSDLDMGINFEQLRNEFILTHGGDEKWH